MLRSQMSMAAVRSLIAQQWSSTLCWSSQRIDSVRLLMAPRFLASTGTTTSTRSHKSVLLQEHCPSLDGVPFQGLLVGTEQEQGWQSYRRFDPQFPQSWDFQYWWKQFSARIVVLGPASVFFPSSWRPFRHGIVWSQAPAASLITAPSLSHATTITTTILDCLMDWSIWLIKRTFQRSIIRKKRKTGFLVRQRTVGGRRTLKRRQAKGRWRLGGGI